ncbi:hypothetical protein ABE237_05450 [Brevibacillus formosus]|uniref:hypothetical protein n=1 Tax=Brevibacillus TaxID=55080 RepID=UPI000D1013F8|nr:MULTISPECIES: hypothetical protein [Brevibacillus]MBG9941402.1 hypothetical protein [Brevibacillus formosus]MED1948841.1 hypothetical protein [Brevibacillus formosus]MED2001364.1 hypothetical protein [Brevibacillus formosus]MED2085449.1 hypothetical protein [Brevibacillus formosus]PSK21745.1 hypothetical protein C7R94_00075 [Brevibacillus sp. NRRL NRS-603]
MSNEKLDILIEGMNELRLVAHALMDRQDELDAKMEALTLDVHQLKADVAELKQDVAELKEGQDRHERILETLALRALEWNNFRLDYIRKSS